MNRDVVTGLFAGALVLFGLPAVSLADFVYTDFSSATGMVPVGVAAISDGALRVTPADASYSAGAAWRSDRQFIADGFDTTFTFRMSAPIWPSTIGADGLAFVVQDFGANAIGMEAHGLGYKYISRSLAVEIDTFVNDLPVYEVNDPLFPHVAVMSRGELPNLPDHHVAELGLMELADDLNDDQERTFRVRYTPGSLDVFFDGASSPSISVPLDLAEYIGTDDGYAWVGFTSGTGAATADHDVTSWSFQTVPEPATLSMLGMAGAALLARRRRATRV